MAESDEAIYSNSLQVKLSELLRTEGIKVKKPNFFEYQQLCSQKLNLKLINIQSADHVNEMKQTF